MGGWVEVAQSEGDKRGGKASRGEGGVWLGARRLGTEGGVGGRGGGERVAGGGR